jgi:hypothetical protein
MWNATAASAACHTSNFAQNSGRAPAYSSLHPLTCGAHVSVSSSTSTPPWPPPPSPVVSTPSSRGRGCVGAAQLRSSSTTSRIRLPLDAVLRLPHDQRRLPMACGPSPWPAHPPHGRRRLSMADTACPWPVAPSPWPAPHPHGRRAPIHGRRALPMPGLPPPQSPWSVRPPHGCRPLLLSSQHLVPWPEAGRRGPRGQKHAIVSPVVAWVLWGGPPTPPMVSSGGGRGGSGRAGRCGGRRWANVAFGPDSASASSTCEEAGSRKERGGGPAARGSDHRRLRPTPASSAPAFGPHVRWLPWQGQSAQKEQRRGRRR